MAAGESKKKCIILASHAYPLNGRFGTRSGPVQPLLDYFSNKIDYFFLIGQPPPYIEGSLAPFLFIYREGALEEKIFLNKLRFLFNIRPRTRKNKTYLRLKIRDFFSVLYFARVIKRKYTESCPIWLYFGVESVNTVAGTCIRKLLGIENVVYYIFDWSVKWFKNRLLNFLYLRFDRYACYHSDYIWNITGRIAEGRGGVLKYDNKKLGKQLTVPYGMPFRKDLVGETPAASLNTVVYSGYLSRENGAGLLPDIGREIGRINEKIKLMIVGGGEEFEWVKEKILEYGLKNVILTGHIPDQDEIDRLLVQAQVAIAPYLDIPHSKKKYGDVIKIRNYFACGLPVIATDVPPVAEEIKKEKLGFVVSYDAQEFAHSCVRILSDGRVYGQIRANVIDKAKKHCWENIFGAALKKMGEPAGTSAKEDRENISHQSPHSDSD